MLANNSVSPYHTKMMTSISAKREEKNVNWSFKRKLPKTSNKFCLQQEKSMLLPPHKRMHSLHLNLTLLKPYFIIQRIRKFAEDKHCNLVTFHKIMAGCH